MTLKNEPQMRDWYPRAIIGDFEALFLCKMKLIGFRSLSGTVLGVLTRVSCNLSLLLVVISVLQRIIDLNISHDLYGAYMLKDENKGRLFINNAPPCWDFFWYYVVWVSSMQSS